MLKKSLYINFTNILLQKTDFFVFQSQRSLTNHDVSYNLFRLSLKYLSNFVSNNNLKFPLKLKTFSKIDLFFEYLKQPLIVLIVYKNLLVVSEITKLVFYTTFINSFFTIIQYLFNLNFFFQPRYFIE